MVTLQQVQEFLDAQQQDAESEAFQDARRALLAGDKAGVLALFGRLLEASDEEERALAIRGLAELYGAEATDRIAGCMSDSSPMVRVVACVCLQDFGDTRAVAALVDRLKGDADCQVRGVAASVLGQMGAIEALPDLQHACQADLEVDELGYTPSSQAQDAITSILRDWVSRQIQGTPARSFRESTRRGQLTGTVTAEGIVFDAQSGINHAERYSHLPRSAFGPACAFKMDLQTSMIAPFEIEAEYADPACVIRRLLIYEQISNWDKFNWAVHTILDPAAMKSRP